MIYRYLLKLGYLPSSKRSQVQFALALTDVLNLVAISVDTHFQAAVQITAAPP